MNITNAEKQARFRKKDELKRFADQIFRDGQMVLARGGRNAPDQVLAFLADAVDLPSGWTDDDYRLAVRKLEQFRLDLFSTRDQIGVDVFEGRNVEARFGKEAAGGNLRTEVHEATSKAYELADHVLSAIRLSSCTEVEQAAALMEAARMVGRNLANMAQVPKSNATTMCLATLWSHYERPPWFAEEFAAVLTQQLDSSVRHTLVQRLSGNDTEVSS